MKTLYLLRHAKSSWSKPELRDFDRSLNARGRDAAAEMGHYLADHAMTPALILCSAAQRTRETLALLLPAFAADTVIRIEAGLYGATREELLDRLSHVEAGVASVMVIGHNPGLEDLARSLAASGPKDDLERLSAKYPTAGLAVIRIDAKRWDTIAREEGELERFAVPSNARL
ncbi:MAG: histidine phosphatase family protein [Alphaproteobacteria bacterium]